MVNVNVRTLENDLVKINFAEFKLGGLREKHSVVTWNMRMISLFP